MATTGGTIFINYRKDDSNWNALALYNDLQKYFSKDQLFKDFNAIRPGDDFVVSIENALAKCNVLLVIIGSEWLNAAHKNGQRRLDDPDDFVRLEISAALERGIPVIPVLFDDTPMPRIDELPENLRLLCRRQFVEIDPKRFEDDVRNLAEAIKKMMPEEPLKGNEQSRNQHRTEQQTHQTHQQPEKKPQQHTSYQQQSPAAKPDNNLVWAILTTILCCPPLGIVAIVQAVKVDQLYISGQHAAAKAAADKAKQWSIYSVVLGVVCYLLYFLLVGAQLDSY